MTDISSVKTLVDCCRTFLAAQSDLTALLGSDDEWDTWIFQEKPYAMVQGSGQVGIVLTQEGGWAQPNDYNTMEFPRLGVTIWADPQRDDNSTVNYDDTLEKITRVLFVLNKYLHTTDGDVAYWDTLVVLSSSRMNEPALSEVTDADQLRQAIVYYAVTLGGWLGQSDRWAG